MKVLIIDNYDSFTFNLFQMVQPLVDEPVKVVRNDKITFDELLAHRPDRVILSPGPGHPANEGDFGVCKDVVLQHHRLGCPVLGVCLGHQGIVHYLGGLVVGAPLIVHGKASRIKIGPDRQGLFAGMPDTFEAMRYHSLVAAEERFPDELKVTARDSENGLIMAIAHKTKPLYGVQFHPESIGTPQGGRILENFLQRC
jgi:anthranilate synthase/aminodeoxychorismate synthase-like glutamine amidotransferase